MSIKNISLTPIGKVKSPYKQKFGIPRQANLASSATGLIKLNSTFTDIDCLREVNQFSHLWIIYLFHKTACRRWANTVQPPRLGGKQKVGVFSSRSPFRPNPLGLSAVKYIKHYKEHGSIYIKIGGLDLLNGTPILDIKPYIPYADSIPDANGGYASEKPQQKLNVKFSESAKLELEAHEIKYENLRSAIIETCSLDPRPAWNIDGSDSKQYGVSFFGINIKFVVNGDVALITSLQKTEAD